MNILNFCFLYSDIIVLLFSVIIKGKHKNVCNFQNKTVCKRKKKIAFVGLEAMVFFLYSLRVQA